MSGRDTLRGFRVGVLTRQRGANDPFRNNDATMGGISSVASDLTVVGIIDSRGKVTTRSQPNDVTPMPEEMRLHVPTDEQPACALAVDHLFGDTARPRLTLIPVHLAPGGYVRTEGGHVMAGGNFADTIDSRWSRLLAQYGLAHPLPLPIHDRIEPWR